MNSLLQIKSQLAQRQFETPAVDTFIDGLQLDL